MDASLITKLVTPIVSEHNLEIDRVEVLPAGKRRLVRIFLDGDGPAGRGPSLDQIAEATKAISRGLDDARGLGNAPYTLEVSSRGVSRPLAEAKHYRRNHGRLVLLSLADGASLTGRITTVGESSVTLEVDGAHREVALAEVAKAVVQVELSRASDEDEDDEDDADLADEDLEDEEGH